MTTGTAKTGMYATVSMAEILLSQNLAAEAEKVILVLQKRLPGDPRVTALAERLAEMRRPPAADTAPSLSPTGFDRIALENASPGIGIEWELTESGLAMAKRAVRYSGRPVIRLFTAAAGRRGVRTGIRDIDIHALFGRTVLAGMPRPAVHTAAVGYLANTGVFISCSQSLTLKVLP